MSRAAFRFQINDNEPPPVGVARIFAMEGVLGLGESDTSVLLNAASGERRVKAMRFLKVDDMIRSLLAEALVRFAFEDVGLGKEISFPWRRGVNGKPFFEDLRVKFNISHSGDWVICGLSGTEIGLDVERHHIMDMGIAERYFTSQESHQIDVLGSKAFFDIWSAKESYLKAIGLGLSCSLDSFSCIPNINGRTYRPSLHDGSLPLASIQSLILGSGYSASVCLLSESLDASLKYIKAKDIVARLQT